MNGYKPIGFISVVDVERATVFYRDRLGLRLLGEELPFAIVFEANGIMLRLIMSKQIAQGCGTVFGWEVPDIVAAVDRLQDAGVNIEHYEFVKDTRGIWTAPDWTKVAWFRDPDGNILSVSQSATQQ